MHLNGKLENIIQALGLRLSLRDTLAPNIKSMSPHKHRISVRPVLDSLFKRIPQILFVSRIFDDRDPEFVVVAQVACFFFAVASGDTLDLFDLLDFKDIFVEGGGLLAEEGYKDCGLRVGMDATLSIAHSVGCHEEWGASRGFEDL